MCMNSIFLIPATIPVPLILPIRSTDVLFLLLSRSDCASCFEVLDSFECSRQCSISIYNFYGWILIITGEQIGVFEL